jgi:hypothetical protein
VIILVLGFKTSSNLASAYGIAVTLTMMIDTLLAFVVVRALWNWNWLQAGLFLALFIVVDFAFFSANLVKVLDGGWFPLVLGLGDIYPVRHLEARPHPALRKTAAGLDAARRLPFQPASTAVRSACRVPASS